MYFKIEINKTSKTPYSKEEHFSTWDNEVLSFGTIEAVKNEIKARYGGVKQKEKMYVDIMKSNGAKHIGYIYHYRNSDVSHNSEEWIQEDWVSVSQVEVKRVEPKIWA